MVVRAGRHLIFPRPVPPAPPFSPPPHPTPSPLLSVTATPLNKLPAELTSAANRITGMRPRESLAAARPQACRPKAKSIVLFLLAFLCTARGFAPFIATNECLLAGIHCAHTPTAPSKPASKLSQKRTQSSNHSCFPSLRLAVLIHHEEALGR